jgi:hypothetical protein
MTLSAADFNQRYRHTFIRWKSPQGVVPIHISSVHVLTDKKGIVEFSTKHTGSGSLNYPDCLSVFDLSQPTPGYFNLNGAAIYFFKYPDRQWSRGICNANSELYNPLKQLIPYVSVYVPTLGYATANAMFNREFIFDIREVINRLEKGDHLSVAISPKMMVSLSPSEEAPYLLWYGCNPIGQWKDNKFEICDKNYEQEVIDECRLLGVPHQWIKF